MFVAATKLPFAHPVSRGLEVTATLGQRGFHANTDGSMQALGLDVLHGQVQASCGRGMIEQSVKK